MKLQTKIILSILPIVGGAILLTGLLVVDYAVTASHEGMHQYSQGLLESYVTHDLAARVEMLERNRLDEVPSFVEAYKKEAIESAKKLRLIWPGRLFIAGPGKTLLYCSTKVEGSSLPEQWHGPYELAVSGQEGFVHDHDTSGLQESYMALYFEPWQWVVFVTVDDEYLHAQERAIWLVVGLVGVGTMLALLLCLGLVFRIFIMKPVRHLHAATDAIAGGADTVSIPVPDGDEFGDLSRDIEDMAAQVGRARAEMLRTNEELRALGSMKSALISNVSHELRTPLTGIVGFAKLGLKKVRGPLRQFLEECGRNGLEQDLERTEKLAKLKVTLEQTFSTISEQGSFMADMVDNIIVLQSLVSGEVTPRPAAFDLADLTRGVCAGFEEQARERGLTLTAPDEQTGVEVVSDSGMVRQALEQFLSNAIRFTDTGGVEVSVRRDQEMAVVAVRDTGGGIPDNATATMFEQFNQAWDDGATKPRGLGIGLSIAREISLILGGRVWVENEPGQGATFSFAVPVSAPDAG